MNCPFNLNVHSIHKISWMQLKIYGTLHDATKNRKYRGQNVQEYFR